MSNVLDKDMMVRFKESQRAVTVVLDEPGMDEFTHRFLLGMGLAIAADQRELAASMVDDESIGMVYALAVYGYSCAMVKIAQDKAAASN